MSIQTRLITADEFLAWPDEPGFRQELIRGEVVTMSLPGGEHGEVAMEIGRLIATHVKTLRLGKTYAAETGFLVERDPDTVRGADVAFVASRTTGQRSRIARSTSHSPPTWPSKYARPTTAMTRSRRRSSCGWPPAVSSSGTVDPENRTVVVHRAGPSPSRFGKIEEIDGGDVIPGFRCRVADFFA